ncbi:MAG: (d)CMP kinase [Clostridiales bacterium]|mgnify:FL=1|nr:(d)CMP kinase [Clostridiales bacterium]
MKIAIDGPGGAGKSCLARNLAKKLGLKYVDTGALYRTIGLAAARRGIKMDDTAGIVAMLPDVDISLDYKDGRQCVFLSDEDVSDAIRTPEISLYASAVSAIPEVREFLFDLQRTLAAKGDVVMDGRDIGTVIMPDADVKIFLYASIEDRAKRRFDELTRKGMSVTYEEVLADMKKRDSQDSGRKIAPAIPAEDAVLLDNSSFADPADTFAAAIRIINEKTGASYDDVL